MQQTEQTKQTRKKSPATEALLAGLYKNAKMGADSMVDLLSRVQKTELKSAMTLQTDGYEKHAARAKELLRAIGCEEQAKEENALTKMSAKMGMHLNLASDAGDSHLAQMVVEGSTMGINDAVKLLRRYENTDAGEDALNLAREMIDFEQENIERMKSFF